jgi:pentatricopeptide repeat protein
MQRDKIPMNTVIYTTMIKAYSKEWQLDKAYALYEKMLDQMKENPSVAPNTVTYNSLIDICVRCFDIPKAKKLFDHMQSGFATAKPDLITYSTMIKGFCKNHNIEAALTALNTMEASGIKADEVLYNSLLDGCCRVGELEIAFKVFQNM